MVKPLSLAAAHCMGEVTLSTETRESDHNYPNDHVDEVSSAFKYNTFKANYSGLVK